MTRGPDPRETRLVASVEVTKAILYAGIPAAPFLEQIDQEEQDE
jgi:hypothetical protein